MSKVKNRISAFLSVVVLALVLSVLILAMLWSINQRWEIGVLIVAVSLVGLWLLSGPQKKAAS